IDRTRLRRVREHVVDAGAVLLPAQRRLGLLRVARSACPGAQLVRGSALNLGPVSWKLGLRVCALSQLLSVLVPTDGLAGRVAFRRRCALADLLVGRRRVGQLVGTTARSCSVPSDSHLGAAVCTRVDVVADVRGSLLGGRDLVTGPTGVA